MVLISLIRKELREQLRSKKLLALMMIFLFFGIISPLTAKYLPDIMAYFGKTQGIKMELPTPQWKDAVAQFVKNITQMCSFVLILLTMGSVAREKERGTAVFLLVKPVSRSSFLVAKFLSNYLVVFISLFVASLVTYAYTILYFETLPAADFVYCVSLMLLYLLTIVSFTIFFSTLAKSQILAGIFAFFIWMLLGLLAQLGHFGLFFPAQLVKIANPPINWDMIQWQPFLGCGLIILASIFGGIWIFRKWEP